MNNISLLNIYFIFLKIGAILLGGGYVILPILINEVVEKRTLLKQEDIVDYFAISQSLPGIIAANISMFVGYKLRGKLGALVAMFGIITAPFLCIVILASFLANLTNNSIVQGSLWGVGIAVITLITLTIREVWQKSKKDVFFYFILIISLVFLQFFRLSPIKVIIACTVIGILFKKLTATKEQR